MKKTLTDSELSVFAGQLALILHSGISSLEGISILRDDNPSEEGKQILSAVYESLELTGDLAQSLRESGVYPEYFLKMTELGERSGTLEEVMDSLSTYYDRQHTLLTGIKDALTYPLILLGMLLAILIVLLTQVMPVFEEVYLQLGIQIGGAASSVFLIGSLLQKAAFVILLLIIAAVFFCFIALRTGKGKDQLISFVQSIPFVNTIRWQFACARFSNALSIALHSGLDISEGFEIARSLTDQKQFQETLDQAAKLLDEGNDFSDSLRSAGVFSGMDARMVSIGFRTGSAETVLQKISESCQEEADNKIQNAVGMLEPALTAVLSILTGVILVSVMLPLLNVMANLGA